MADQNINLLRLLGRVLTFLGAVWFGIVVLAGIGLLEEFGANGDFLAGVAGSIIPAFLLLAAGRALRRRARAAEKAPVAVATTVPTVPEKRVPTSRTETPTTTLTPPRLPGWAPPPERPSGRPVPRQVEPLPPPSTVATRSLEEVIPPADKAPSGAEPSPSASPLPTTRGKPVPPKTSRELVEEARKKWGAGRRS